MLTTTNIPSEGYFNLSIDKNQLISLSKFNSQPLSLGVSVDLGEGKTFPTTVTITDHLPKERFLKGKINFKTLKHSEEIRESFSRFKQLGVFPEPVSNNTLIFTGYLHEGNMRNSIFIFYPQSNLHKTHFRCFETSD